MLQPGYYIFYKTNIILDKSHENLYDSPMKKELNLFIIWNNARGKEKEILADISENFEIRQVYNITWSKERFADNLTRFYGKKLPKNCKKQQECGTGSFLLVVIHDLKPAVKNNLNGNIIGRKYQYRQWTGGGHLIHAADNQQEAEENLLFLLGTNVKEFEQTHPLPWDRKVIDLKRDLSGAENWKDENEFQTFLNKLPETKQQKTADIPLIISSNTALTCRFLNAAKKFSLIKRNLYKVVINNKPQLIRIKNS